MNDHNLDNIQFYKDQYLFEHERGRFYDKIIQYPTTLLVVFIGSAFYLFNDYYPKGKIQTCCAKDWVFLILVCLFAITIIITIYYLSSVFHGFTRKYYYLPFTRDLLEHEKKLYKHHYKYSDKTKYGDKRIDASQNTCKNYSKNLKQYYIDLTDINQRVNDKRADLYYKTRTFLFFDLILLILIGIVEFTK